MPNSVYKISEIVGTSSRSWEDAARRAVAAASKTLRDLRIAEVSALDMTVENGKVKEFRSKVKLSFKIEAASAPPAVKKKVAKKKVAKKKKARRR